MMIRHILVVTISVMLIVTILITSGCKEGPGTESVNDSLQNKQEMYLNRCCTMKNNLQFRVSAELKNILGRDLITSPDIAIYKVLSIDLLLISIYLI